METFHELFFLIFLPNFVPVELLKVLKPFILNGFHFFVLTENRSFTALRALRYFSGKTPTQGSFTPILLFQTSNISKTIQNTRFYFLEYHQIHLIIGRFQIFSPVPVPVPVANSINYKTYFAEVYYQTLILIGVLHIVASKSLCFMIIYCNL